MKIPVFNAGIFVSKLGSTLAGLLVIGSQFSVRSQSTSGTILGTVKDPPGIAVALAQVQRFLATFVYELPIGKGRLLANSANKVLDRELGGWEVAGVIVAQTKPYMTSLSGNDRSGIGCPELIGNGRADAVSGISRYTGHSLDRWVNPAAFATTAYDIGGFGRIRF